ncbi:MAG TPA: tRNA 2-thiouridine(34) synthase MnmA [Rickettsiales bacterium]|nr:tRNA 2-thiouridine(34) synthase MnmA [Rickettsiales bacterium]
MNEYGIDKAPADTRIVVAMSGGVDSSVVAALLKDQGYDVVGITLQLYDHGAAIGKKGACCAGQDIADARNVAAQINIPHYVLNYENTFRESVMDDFVDSYLSGETPVPCVKCNQSVKFRDLLGTAGDLGADALATGHYVRREMGSAGAELHRAIDKDKDQSYFLFATTQEQLDFLRFPLGGFHKEYTRELAQKYALQVSAKPDSQDICFVPNGNYAGVIEKLRPGACDPGDIVHVDGQVIGRHEGIIHYTVGQRRGLGVAAAEPLYVIRLDAEKKQVVVGPREALLTKRFLVRDLNWLGGNTLLEHGAEVQVRVRSSQMPVEAVIKAAEGKAAAEVTLLDPREAVAPGQACVVYAGDRVLGGGWITKQRS